MKESPELYAVRLELVESILMGLHSMEIDALEEKIFRFGSLIREKDFLERKLFVYMANELDVRKAALL